MRCRIDTAKAVVGSLTFAVLLIIGIAAFAFRYFALAAIAVTLSAVYLNLALKNGGVLVVDKTGIHRCCLGKEIRHWDWGEIKEFGIMGTRVFGSEKAVNHGKRYVYFSENAMNDKERFRMCLNWPPRDCAYAQYTDELMYNAKLQLELEPVYYNTMEP